MAIEFTCPVCGSMLRVAHETSGRLVRCGGCMSMLRVPEVDSTTGIRPRSDEFPRVSARPAEETRPVAVQVTTPPQSVYESEGQTQPVGRKSRGLLFWLVLLAGLGTCGLSVCCLGIVLVMPGHKWQAHESGPGGFAVEFPAEPQPGISAPGIKADAETQVIGARMRGRDEVYAVSYQRVAPPGRRLPDEVFLAAQVKFLEANGTLRRIVRDEALTVSGFAAREVEFTAANGGTYVLRLVIAETRAYRIIAGGRSVSSGNENVRRFLDSFAITDPEVLAAAKNRTEQQQQRDLQTQARVTGQAIAQVVLQSVGDEAARVAARAESLAAVRSAGRQIAEKVLATLPRAPEFPVAPSPRLKIRSSPKPAT
jgi:hypothetical protein